MQKGTVEILLSCFQDEPNTETAEKTERSQKRTLMAPTIASSAHMKSPVKSKKKLTQKPRVSKLTTNDIKHSVKVIPERPKGMFPATDSGDDDMNDEQPTLSKK